jgi:hypothetical protein
LSRLPIKDWAAAEGITVQAANKRIRKHGIRTYGGGRQRTVDADEAKGRFEQRKDALQQQRGTAAKRKVEQKPAANVAPKRIAQAPPSPRTPRRGDSGTGFDLPRIQAARGAVALKRDELLFRRLKGELVERGAAQSAWNTLIINAKTKFLSMGNRLGPGLAAESDPVVCKSLIDSDIEEALLELSRFDFSESQVA